jgi:hypothetical protein
MARVKFALKRTEQEAARGELRHNSRNLPPPSQEARATAEADNLNHLHKIAARRERLGTLEAPDETARDRERRRGIRGAGEQTDGGQR